MIINYILWIICLLGVMFILTVWIIPFIKIKIRLWKAYYNLKKIKNKTPEIKNIIKLSKQTAKNFSINDVYKN